MQNVLERYQAKLLPEVDYEAWLSWTGCILRTPGGKAIWPMMEPVITPTIAVVLKKHLEEYPDAPPLLDLMPVFVRHDLVESH